MFSILEEVKSMKNRVIWLLIISLLLIFSLTCIQTHSQVERIQSNSINYNLNPTIDDIRLNYEYHSAIDIYNDVDLERASSMGFGTIDDPYIIEGYWIADDPFDGILIRDVTKHFVIRNCLIENCMNGIYIDNAATSIVNITNNIIINNDWGIWVIDSLNAIVSDNNCSFNYMGIYLDTTGYTIVKNNTCNYNVESGISIENTLGLEIINNSCNYNQNDHGIRISNDDDTILIQDNSFNYNPNGDGMYVWNFGHGTMSGNSFIGNQNGMYLESTNYIILEDNVFSDNSLEGASLYYSDDFTITENSFSNNQNYGLKMHESRRNGVHHNYFYDNNLGGTSQAYCDGTSVIWYDIVTSEGNYWKSWYNGSYPIDGSAGYYDIYPLDLDPPEIDAVPDIEYLFGETGNNIQWNITDLNPTTYTVYKNFVEILTDSWANGVPIIINIDGLDNGTNVYQIFALDAFGRSSLDTVIVTVTAVIREFNGETLVIFSGLMVALSVYLLRNKKKRNNY